MEHRGVVITAGFDKSQSAIAIAELLKRKKIRIKGFIVVSPYSWKRLKSYINKRGFRFLLEAVPRLLGKNKSVSENEVDYLKKFLNRRNIPGRSIRKWAANNGAEYLSVSSINCSKADKYLNEVSPQWLIYSGGGIIREDLISTMEGNILNAHLGPLPNIRGMNAAEWSILLNENLEVSIHLIDKGIDTGNIITCLSYKVEPGDTINSIRDKAKIRGIEGLVEVASKNNLNEYELRANNSDHRQCYMLSSTMKKLLCERLEYLQKEI